MPNDLGNKRLPNMGSLLTCGCGKLAYEKLMADFLMGGDDLELHISGMLV